MDFTNEDFEQSIIEIKEDKSPKRKKKVTHASPYSSALANSSISPRQQPRSPGVPTSSMSSKTPKKRDESIIEWFDRSVEDELQKRRNSPCMPTISSADRSGIGHALIVESTASGVDIEAELRGGMNTELADAVDKFSKAEAIVNFEGAVRAAEIAAASAPPDMAEEAAVAGAKGYQAELTSTVSQTIPGVRPIEVVGYIGITRPKNVKKS